MKHFTHSIWILLFLQMVHLMFYYSFTKFLEMSLFFLFYLIPFDVFNLVHLIFIVVYLFHAIIVFPGPFDIVFYLVHFVFIASSNASCDILFLLYWVHFMFDCFICLMFLQLVLLMFHCFLTFFS